MNMTNLSPLRRTVVAVAMLSAGVLSATSAHAVATSSISVPQITLTLVDTNLSDSVIPSISFGSGGTITGAGTYVLPMTVPLTAWSGTWSFGTSTPDTFDLSAWTNASFDISYTLATSTQLAGENSYIDLVVGLFGFDGDGDYTSIYKDKSSSSANGSSDSKSGVLHTTFENASSNLADDVNVSIAGSTYGNSVSPVPEPESYAMFMAGLAAIGAVARRRRVR